MPIADETSEIFFGWKIVENQKRNFLTGPLPGNTVAPRKFARNFMSLYNQETIEWELGGKRYREFHSDSISSTCPVA
jgi:hypothetical protein